MKMALRISLLAITLAVGMGGCAQLQNVVTTLESATTGTVSVKAVSVAGNTFDGLEATAKNAIHACRVVSTAPAVCSNRAAMGKLINAVRAGRKARNALEDFYAAHPGQLGPQGLYDALQAAVDTLQSVITTYNIGGK